ncbi:crotonase/enoyl-CoA hydratase family protein [candidate division CSSED10-310 bacterium]|uniref:Crotonase/enoyl-CoA hydratase family protein n=1 Tax=candidate division CSSED10-310 bacterium TaxID=2855610 RepID=A0ABV6Z0X1_UNCC1
MTVRVEKKEYITTIILDRPERRNAIDRDTAEALSKAFRQFEADNDALVAVLFGDHGNFCAGADLKAIASGVYNRVDPEGDGPLGPTRMLLQKPVIAAMAGYATAGGLELALWCDLRVMEEDATLGCFERRWGVPLLDGGTVRLPRLIGLSRALDLILTGRPVEAEEAARIGLVHRVVPTGTAREAAEKLALKLAKFPQLALRGDRLSAYEQFDFRLDKAIENEFQHGLAGIQYETLRGATRFAEGAGRHGEFDE